MTRTLLAACLFAGMSFALLSAGTSAQQPAQKKAAQPKARGKYDPPAAKKPDDATLKQIADKTDQLRKAVAALKAKKIPDDVLIEVEIYLKAAENIVRFEEWYHANSGKWALTTLDQGLERARHLANGKAPWRDEAGKWLVRAYRSSVDDSIQPYAVLLPHDYGKDPKKRWRLDIVLHGRDSSLTEAKFIATHQGAAPKDLGYVQLEVYGRGNNAYRWAGEKDVFESFITYLTEDEMRHPDLRLSGVTVLRGFSMGGAGTWQIGLHHPDYFRVIGPGAGFTTTHGYIANLPKQLPDYQEKCLRIYDAVDYAENAFNVPVVAYSGERDPQKAAADNIERLLKGFKEPVRFTHLVAPGLEHQMPKEWQEKAEAEYHKYTDATQPKRDRVRFVTYTPRYGRCDWVSVKALEKQYQRALVDARRTPTGVEVTTQNIRTMWVSPLSRTPEDDQVTIDGARFKGTRMLFEKRDGKWSQLTEKDWHDRLETHPEKVYEHRGIQGPIDDTFMDAYCVALPSTAGWHPPLDKHHGESAKQFAYVWDRYFRGSLPTIKAEEYDPKGHGNLVLFGDPQSNPLIARVLPHLPITWTKEKLVINGVEYDASSHLPVLIYPNPLAHNSRYVVINSGHTFKEADLKGTNALLYPRLGDWAVIKPTPTAKDPAAYEVVAAGLFDENWQFPKK